MLKYSLLRIAIISLVIFASNQNLYAKDSYTTIGRKSCKSWNEDLKKYNLGTKQDMFSWIAFASDRSWILGFASGVNSMLDDDVLDSLDVDILVDWTSKYCQENVEDNVTDAIFRLIAKTKEISAQKSKNNSKK